MSEFQKQPITISATPIRKKIKIKTLEGTLYGLPGEWLITGVKGEKYPCKDDVFRETYKPVGKDKCSFCKYVEEEKRPCDVWEVCTFSWKPKEYIHTVGHDAFLKEECS